MIFIGGLGTTRTMWRAQLKAFSDAHAIDLPGHGEAALTGRVDVESIARSVLAAAPQRFAFCGLSLGGMVGMWLGVFAPDRVDRLVLACTGPKLGDRESYYERADLVRREGTAAVAAGARERWFSAPFRNSPEADNIINDLRGIGSDGYAACCEAVGDFDFRAEVGKINVPTLVVFGSEDPMTPAAVRDEFGELRSVEIAGAHLAPVESPNEFNHQLRSFA